MGSLSFDAPHRLWLLIIPIAMVIAYLVMQRRRRSYAVKFTNVDLLDSVAPDRPGWRRHLPALLLLFALVVGAMGFAKPARAEEVASKGGVVMLAIDTSLSMEATDVSPTRIDAAKAAAVSFLKSLPDGVRVGVVGFDGSSHILLDPTTDTDAVKRTIDRLQLGEGTAIGEAVFSALEAINTPDPANTGDATTTTTPPTSTVKPTDGKFAGAVVLLSDGETTQGRPNDEAAQAASAAGVAVNTIAFGTDSGIVTGPDGSQIPVPVNRDALKTLADQTGGTYSSALTADQLKQVYAKLGQSAVSHETVHHEITDWFTFAAMALALLAGIGSLVWFSRLP
ncbi:MAG TPA: VWA domain-containing protein [Ilumatobacteraceae bacterium]|jgi:Ca-activated chloride channel family protein|nr:VWA domain-containing protein [Ilumatobacteraceae bacterium]